jgi:ABC-type molybdate transport system substrate-binding protein
MCYSFVGSAEAVRRGVNHENLLVRHLCHAVALASRGGGTMNVLISGGFSGAYEQLLPEFERTTGIKVATGSGASQGAGPQTIAAQLARGVPANVVILSREGLSELIAAKRIVAGTDVDLARVPLGVAVRAGTPKPDVSTAQGQNRRGPRKYQRYLAYERSLSAARHRGKDQRQGHAARHGRNRHGRRRRRGSRGHAGQ